MLPVTSITSDTPFSLVLGYFVSRFFGCGVYRACLGRAALDFPPLARGTGWGGN
jgi:hypothetical protein